MRLIETSHSEAIAARNVQISEEARELGEAHVMLCKAAGTPVKTHSLSGRLVLSDSNWLLLTVPNSLVRGAFDALDEHGVELPLNSEGRLNAHISVMDVDEVAKIGVNSTISERGHPFSYTLGPIKEVEPEHFDDVSKVWYITVDSPDLRSLRKSYGLDPLHKGHDFHITIAKRRKHVLKDNEVSKSSAVKEAEPHIASPMNQSRVFNPAGIPLPVPAAVLASSTLLGSLLAEDQGKPITDRLRGGFKGLATGAGGLGGTLLSDSLGGGGYGAVAGAGAGALSSLLAADRLSKILGLDTPKKKSYRDELGELLGKKSSVKEAGFPIRMPRSIPNPFPAIGRAIGGAGRAIGGMFGGAPAAVTHVLAPTVPVQSPHATLPPAAVLTPHVSTPTAPHAPPPIAPIPHAPEITPGPATPTFTPAPHAPTIAPGPAPTVAPVTNVPLTPPMTMRRYWRSMAGIPEGQTFGNRPVSSVWNATWNNFADPFLSQNHPRLASGVRWANRAITAGPLAYGIAQTADSPSIFMGGLARQVGFDQPEEDLVRSRTRERTPEIWQHMLTGSDPVSTATRSTLLNSYVGNFRHGMFRLRRDHPWLAYSADAASMMSPFGIARNAASYYLQTPSPPDNMGIARNALQQNLPSLSDIQSNPHQSFQTINSAINSPMTRIYGDIYNHPQLLNSVSPVPIGQQQQQQILNPGQR